MGSKVEDNRCPEDWDHPSEVFQRHMFLHLLGWFFLYKEISFTFLPKASCF